MEEQYALKIVLQLINVLLKTMKDTMVDQYILVKETLQSKTPNLKTIM